MHLRAHPRPLLSHRELPDAGQQPLRVRPRAPRLQHRRRHAEHERGEHDERGRLRDGFGHPAPEPHHDGDEQGGARPPDDDEGGPHAVDEGDVGDGDERQELVDLRRACGPQRERREQEHHRHVPPPSAVPPPRQHEPQRGHESQVDAERHGHAARLPVGHVRDPRGREHRPEHDAEQDRPVGIAQPERA